MTKIVTWCRRCGIEFVADRPSVLAGTWRACPDCRGRDVPKRPRKRGHPEGPPGPPTAPPGATMAMQRDATKRSPSHG